MTDVPPPPLGAFPTEGATRLFEMQLMPALLLQLQIYDLAGLQELPQQGDANSSLSNQAHNVANSAPSRTTPTSAAGPAEGGALTPSSADDANSSSTDPTGVAQEGGDGASTGELPLKNEEGDREERETTPMPTPSVEDRERLRTWGMDWGVVGVWSCPRSCDVSCEECVVVQLPV